MPGSGDDYTSDQRIIERIASGDRQAFEKLFFTHYESLFHFSCSICENREVARDVLQDVFFSFWQRRKSIRLEGSLKSYLFRAVKNRTFDQLRKRKSRQNFRNNRKRDRSQEVKIRQQHEIHEGTDPGADFTIDFRKQLVQEIWDNVEKMPPQRRRVFLLYRKHGLNYKEIAYVLGISEKSVENHLARALAELRTKLKGEHSSKDRPNA